MNLGSDGVKWLSATELLYIRPCYKELASMLCNDKINSALLLGTPGIGKSLFMRWLMMVIVRDACEKNITDLTFRYKEGENDYMCRLDGCSVTAFSSGTPAYFFSDSCDVMKLGLSSKLTLLVSSDDDSHYKEWKKKVVESGEGGIMIYMPVFSLDELQCLRPVGMKNEDIEFRYMVVGGSARELLGTGNFITNDAIKSLVTDEFDCFFRGLTVSEGNKNWAVGTVMDALASPKNDKAALVVFNRLFKHIQVNAEYKQISVEWSSRFLMNIAGAVTQRQNVSILDELRKLFGRSGEGCAFEYLGHRRVIENPTKSYALRGLGINNINMSFDISQRKFIRTVDDIRKLERGDYGLPTTSTFPLIDAVIFPNILLQYTISDTHKGAKLQLESIVEQLKKLDATAIPIMIFVVPLEVVAGFRKVSDLNILQYVTSYEQHVAGYGEQASPTKKIKGR